MNIVDCKKILDLNLNKQEELMFSMLEKIVNMSSFTSEGKNVEKVGQFLVDFLQSHGFYIKKIPKKNIPENESWLQNHGDSFVAKTHPFNEDPGIALTGHLDTVFSHEHVSNHKFKLDKVNDRAYGPGVADMKAGLIANIFAAIALKKNNLLSCPITLTFSADEELGSPTASNALKDYLIGAKAAINAEPGGIGNFITLSRKGSGHFTMNIYNENFSDSSYENSLPILELVQKTLLINSLLDLSKSQTVNTGLIEGNTENLFCLPYAQSKIHITYQTLSDGNNLVNKIEQIANKKIFQKTKTRLSGGLRLYPLERTEKGDQLFYLAQEAGKLLGLSIKGQHYESAAESGFFSSILHIPTICCMGPEGENIHSRDEYFLPSTMLPRCKCIALTAYLAANHFK